MTISTSTNRYTYAGNGVTTAFAYSSRFLANADIVVLLVVDATGVSTTQVLTTNYTMTGAGDAGGGTITMLVAPPTGTTLVIYGDPEIKQATDFVENDALPAETLETAYDRLTLIAARLKDQISRAFKLNDADTTTSPTLPTPTASSGLGWNAAGTALVNYIFQTGTSLIDLVASTGSSLVGFIQSGTGAVARTMQDKEREIVSVTDFYANGVSGVAVDPTGVTESTLGIIAAGTSGAKNIFIPPGIFLSGSITPPAGVTLYGSGPTSSILKAKPSLNAPVIILANSNNTLRDFGIAGNSANQSVGPGDSDGVRATGGSRYVLENIVVDDVVDWGFRFESCSNIRVKTCDATNLVGGTSSVAVRGCFVFGTTGLPCTNSLAIGCNATGGGTYTDGFMAENGSNQRIIGCNANVPYTGFKFNEAARVIAKGNYATGGVAGFQTLGSINGLTLSKNIAYQLQGSGFQFNQIDTVTPSRNWVISGNQSIENGQDAGATTRYGFAFELSPACAIDNITFSENIAVDNQGVATQLRGLSFSTDGSVTNAVVSGNSGKGHANDIIVGASFDYATAVVGPNNFTTGAEAPNFTPAKASHQLRFWVDNVVAAAGVTALNDGLGARGYVMARAGYVRSHSALSNAATTVGDIIFQPRKNGSNFTSNITVSSGTFNTVNEIPKAITFAAGDIITCIYTSTAGLLPTGTNDFDVVIEVVYD